MPNFNKTTIRNRIHLLKKSLFDDTEEIVIGYQVYNLAKLNNDYIQFGDYNDTGTHIVGNTLGIYANNSIDMSINTNGEIKIGIRNINLWKKFICIDQNELLLQSDELIKLYGKFITIDGLLDVTGATTLNDTLTVNKGTTLNDTLSVAKATTLKSTLDVTGNTTIGGTLGVTGATTLNDTLSVAKATTLKSTLGVTGATTLNDTLTVSKATILNDTLDVTKDVTIGTTSKNANLTVHGTFTADSTTLDSLIVKNDTKLLGDTDIGNTGLTVNNGQLITNKTLNIWCRTTNIKGNTTIGIDGSYSLTVNSATILNDTLTVADNKLTLLGGQLVIKQKTTIGSETNNADLTVCGAISGGNGTLHTLTVTDWSTLLGNVNIGNTGLTVNNGKTVTDKVLNIWCETTNIKGALNVTGATNLSSLSITGNASIDGTLTVTGATTLKSKLTIGYYTNTTSNTISNSMLDLYGVAKFIGKYSGTTTGNTIFEVKYIDTTNNGTQVSVATFKDVYIDANKKIIARDNIQLLSCDLILNENSSDNNKNRFITAKNKTFITGTKTNSDGTTTQITNLVSGINIGTIDGTSRVNINDSCILYRTLNVFGDTTLKKLTVDSVLTVNSAVDFKSTLTVAGTTTIAGNVTIGSDESGKTRQLTVNGATTILYTTTIGKANSTDDKLIINGNASIKNNLSVTNTAKLNILTTSGSATIGTTLTVSGATTTNSLKVNNSTTLLGTTNIGNTGLTDNNGQTVTDKVLNIWCGTTNIKGDTTIGSKGENNGKTLTVYGNTVLNGYNSTMKTNVDIASFEPDCIKIYKKIDISSIGGISSRLNLNGNDLLLNYFGTDSNTSNPFITAKDKTINCSTAISESGTLAVEGITIGTISGNGKININGHCNMYKGLAVYDTISALSGLIVSGDTNLATLTARNTTIGSETNNSDLIVHGNLTVDKVATLKDSTNIGTYGYNSAIAGSGTTVNICALSKDTETDIITYAITAYKNGTSKGVNINTRIYANGGGSMLGTFTIGNSSYTDELNINSTTKFNNYIILNKNSYGNSAPSNPVSGQVYFEYI